MSNSTPYISVIIPIYNNRKADIERCFNSILNQTFFDYEVIIVNDGSNSECSKNIEHLARNFRNYRIIVQRNCGVSRARNTGISIACGKYVTFIDGDDYILPNMLQEAVSICIESDIDVLYGMVKYTHSKEISDMKPNLKNSKYVLMQDTTEIKCHMIDLSIDKFHYKSAYVSRGPVARFVRNDLCKKIKFDTGLKFGEDEDWNLRLLQTKVKIGICYSLWYLYIHNENSTLHAYRNNYIEEHTKRLDAIYKYVNNEEMLISFIHECLNVLKDISYYYFFSKQNNDGFMEKYSKFNKISYMYKWKDIFIFKRLIRLDNKAKITFILWKSKLLFFVLKMNNVIKTCLYR